MTSTKLLTKISFIAMFALYSCSANPIIETNKSIENISSSNIESFTIKGNVQFDDSFKIKSENVIATRATVSLIYPSSFSDTNLRNTTIATGLTDLNGNFFIKFNSNTNIPVNQILTLESSKRIGGAGNAKISLRTNIRWNGTKWESISSPKIQINRKTTALSLISSYVSSILSPEESIGKLIYSNSVGNVIYGNKLTPSRYNSVYKAIDKYIEEGKDPIEQIISISDLYDTINDYTYSSILQSYMHTLQTAVETYAVDHSGIYPTNVANLEEEARDKNYWKELKNPFSGYQDIPAYLPKVMDLSEYNQAKSTLTYQSHTLNDKSELRGITLYAPVTSNSVYTSYYIYGVNNKGDLLKVDERDDNSEIFFLTNQ